MTCIIGIETDKYGTLLAADRMASNGWIGLSMDQSKIIENGDFLIAGCGNPRHTDILEHVFEAPRRHVDDPPMKYLVRDVIAEIGETFERCRAVTVKDGAAELDSSFLIAYEGKLYPLYGHFAIIREDEILPGIRVSAMGSGGEHAWSHLIASFEQIIVGQQKGYDIPLNKAMIEGCAHDAIANAPNRRVTSVGGKVDIRWQPLPGQEATDGE